jgi:hypothetical protein
VRLEALDAGAALRAVAQRRTGSSTWNTRSDRRSARRPESCALAPRRLRRHPDYGICSPASTAIGSVFSGGGSGQVANSVYAHGRLVARLKSMVTVPSAAGGSI